MSVRSSGASSGRAVINCTRDWPLVGRDAELQVGRQILQHPGGSLVLGGAAGVGKSRLALELAELIAADLDAQVVRVIASAALSDVPGAALAPLIRLSAQVPGDEASQDTGILLTRMHGAIAAAAAERPLLVLVDDAHLLDEVSAAALRQLVVSESARIVATVRSGEPIPADVAGLARGERGDRLELMSLSPADVDTLLRAVLGVTPAPETTRMLADRSGGNCLALRALVLDGAAADRFTTAHGVVRWEPTGPVGPRLIDLVDSWLGTLDPDESRALLVMALGAPVPARVRLGPPADAQALDRLEARGAVVTDEQGTMRLGHQLYGDACRARATSSEVAAARRALIDAFLDAMRPDLVTFAPDRPGVMLHDLDAAADLLRVAGWLLEDGDHGDGSDDSAVDGAAGPDRQAIFAAAAEVAARLGAIESAATIAQAAVASGGVAVLAVLAEAEVRLGRTDDAEAAIDRLWDELDQPPAYIVRRALQTELTIHLLHRHDREAAAAAVTAALDRVTDDADRSFITATSASFLAMVGELDEAGRALGDLTGELPEVRLRAMPGRVAVLVAAGRIDAAVALADDAVAEALAVQDVVPEGLRWSISALANALLTGGYLDRMWHLIELGRTFETVDSEASAFRGLMEGRALLFAGRGNDARAALGVAADWYGARNQRMRVRWLLALLAEATLLAGDRATAETIAREARAADRADNLADHDADRALAWVDACTGGVVPSAAGSLTVADAAAAAHARPFELLALWDAFRLTSSKSARRRIAGLAPSISSPLARLIGAGAAARTAADLDEAATAFADAGFEQWAAEIARRAASAHRDEGRRSAAARSDSQADAWWEACGRPLSPGLAGPPAAGVDLTRREAEVANLAAEGSTSRAIAEQLGISVRTVDNLLGKVYLKLGIAGRDALAEALAARSTR